MPFYVSTIFEGDMLRRLYVLQERPEFSREVIKRAVVERLNDKNSKIHDPNIHKRFETLYYAVGPFIEQEFDDPVHKATDHDYLQRGTMYFHDVEDFDKRYDEAFNIELYTMLMYLALLDMRYPRADIFVYKDVSKIEAFYYTDFKQANAETYARGEVATWNGDLGKFELRTF